MLDNLIKRKNAQVATTTTWVVATVVIIVVLSISIFATIGTGIDQQIIILDDKKKDFLMTKSSTSFLSNEKNVELLEDKDYEILKIKFKDLFSSISGYRTPLSDARLFLSSGTFLHSGIWIWGIELREDGVQKIIVRCNEISYWEGAFLPYEVDFSLENLKLKFGASEC